MSYLTASEGHSKRLFGQWLFPRQCDLTAQLFCIFLLTRDSAPPKNRSSGRNAGEVVRSTAKATPGAGWFLAETGPRNRLFRPISAETRALRKGTILGTFFFAQGRFSVCR